MSVSEYRTPDVEPVRRTDCNHPAADHSAPRNADREPFCHACEPPAWNHVMAYPSQGDGEWDGVSPLPARIRTPEEEAKVQALGAELEREEAKIHAARAAGQPQPDLREQSSDEIRRTMLRAISGYAGPVIADLAARCSERWTEDQFVAQWGKSLGDLITAVRREETDAKQAESDNLRAFIERGFDTHMQFGLLNADGTTTMLPCADWCHACKVEKATARGDIWKARAVAIEQDRDALLNQPALRLCIYPACLRQFDLSGRPARPEWSSEGWLQVRAGDGYVCPDHAAAVRVHTPRWLATGKFLACACGWESPAVRWRGYGAEAWKDHLLTETEPS